MTTQHETAIKGARDAYWSEIHHGSGYDDSKPYEAAISAYLSSIGGVVCHREPVAYACSTRPNHLWSAAQFNNADPKNRTDCDIPLHAPLPAPPSRSEEGSDKP